VKSRGALARTAAALTALAACTLTATPARADEESARVYFTIGIPLTLSSVFSDTLQWGLIGTTSASAHWTWHMVPGAGPVIGFLAFGNDHCGPGHNEPQCNVPSLLIQGTELVYFGAEVAGLALVGAGLYKRTQPRIPALTASSPLPLGLVPRFSAGRAAFSLGVSREF
jgi:hypothetical protein